MSNLTILELLSSFQTAVNAIAADADIANGLNAEATALDVQLVDLKKQIVDIGAEATTKRSRAADLLKNSAARAEAEEIWRQIGEYLTFNGLPVPANPVAPQAPLSPVGTTSAPGGPVLTASNGTWAITASGQLKKNDIVLPETNSVTSIKVEPSILQPGKTTIRQFAWNTSWLYEPSHPRANSQGWVDQAVEVVTQPTVPAPAVPVNSALKTFPTTAIARWNYDQVYHPVEGAQPGKMPDGFIFDFNNLVPNQQGELIHRLNAVGGAAIKWESEKKLKKTQGHYIVEATFGDPIWPNVVYNPLWLFSEGDAQGGHEFDFEYMNGRLEYNLHNGRGGFTMKSTLKDLGGHRCRWEIIRRPDSVTMKVTSLTDGWTDELEITPALVASWTTRAGAPANLVFPPNTVAMFPVTELWRTRWPNWSGTWKDLPAGEYVTMTLHGYNFLA